MKADLPLILIADHDPHARAALAQALQPAGFVTAAVAGGREALDRLSRERAGLLVVEAGLPDIGGLDVLKALRRRGQATPVVVTSANGSVAEAVAAVQAGAVDYLLKPLIPESLVACARKALEPSPGGRRPPDPRAERKTLITQDPRLLEVLATARRVARSTATVLITGESGTGKELLAAYIHRHSAAPEAPYVAVNCAALPETLAESELFGHEKGAFTGALTRKIGKFELARKGTLVLDEIGEMPLALQAKLLRVLQEREIDRVGGVLPVPIEARVVAVTNRELSEAVAGGRFREDLYYRINVVPLRIPPLRERLGDIPLLAHHFLGKFNVLAGCSVARFSGEALDLLSRGSWKGNVRELENAVERAVLLADGEAIQPRHLQLPAVCERGRPAGTAPPVRLGTTVWEMERQLIMDTLSGVRNNRARAAELLGISIRTLRNKLKEYRERTDAGTAAEAASARGTKIAASQPAAAS
jgi:DNA-binding NtrC family response regulator